MAMLAYMKVSINGNAVDGGCKQKPADGITREKTCEVVAFDHTVNLPVNIDSGTATGTRVHRPITATIHLDEACPLFMDAICNGKKADGEFWFFRNNPEKEGGLEHYYYVKFTNGRLISCRQITMNSEMENTKKVQDLFEIQFTYETIEWKQVPASKSGADSWLGK